MEQYKKNFLSKNIILTVVQGLARIKSLLFLPLITKWLGVNDYGLWAQMRVTVEFFIPLVTLNLGFAFTRYIPATDEHEQRESFYAVLLITLGVFCLISGLIALNPAVVSSFLFGESNHTLLVYLLLPILLFTIIKALCMNFIRSKMEFGRYSFFLLFCELSELLLVCIAIFARKGLTGALIALVVTQVISAVLLMWSICSRIGFAIPRFGNIPRYLKFSLPMMMSFLAYLVVKTSDRYILIHFQGIEVVGEYSAISNFAAILLFFISSFTITLSPTISDLWNNNLISEMKQIMSLVFKCFILFTLPVLLVLNFAAVDLITLLSTAQIAASSSKIMPFISLAIFFYGISSLFTRGFYLREKGNLSGLLWTICGLLNVAANFVLVQKYGVSGVAFASMCSFLVVLVVSMAYMYYHGLMFCISGVFLIKCACASLLMLGVVRIITGPQLWQILAAITAGMGIYFAALYVLGELRFVGQLLQRRGR